MQYLPSLLDYSHKFGKARFKFWIFWHSQVWQKYGLSLAIVNSHFWSGFGKYFSGKPKCCNFCQRFTNLFKLIFAYNYFIILFLPKWLNLPNSHFHNYQFLTNLPNLHSRQFFSFQFWNLHFHFFKLRLHTKMHFSRFMRDKQGITKTCTPFNLLASCQCLAGGHILSVLFSSVMNKLSTKSSRP